MLIRFLLVICVLTVESVKGENEAEKAPTGILDAIIMQVLDNLKPQLAEVKIKGEDFKTGLQEFGEFEGKLKNIVILGLDNFEVKKLSTTDWSINNLTIVEKEFKVNGYYDINGTLSFPLGRNDIHFYGNGEMSAEFTDFAVSMKLILELKDEKRVIEELDFQMFLKEMKIDMRNLMGGGDLEYAFNKIINDVGMTVFNYYKRPVLDIVKKEVRKLIDEILNQQLRSKVKMEL